jgi:hypothetical protein
MCERLQEMHLESGGVFKCGMVIRQVRGMLHEQLQ